MVTQQLSTREAAEWPISELSGVTRAMHLLVAHACTVSEGSAGVTEGHPARSMQTSAQAATARTAAIMACAKPVETWTVTACAKTVEQLGQKLRVHSGLWSQDHPHFMNHAYTTQVTHRRSIY